MPQNLRAAVQHRAENAAAEREGDTAMFFVAFLRKIARALVTGYRPELHYMRGPGPACQAARRRVTR